MAYDFAFYQLRTYREVARLGSITKAARSLGYAQSSVTSHIRSLEGQVGAPLVQRLPRGVRLTAAGEVFNEYAGRLLLVLDELADALNPSGAVEGRVVVGASALLMENRVGALVRECRYRYPGVRISPRQVEMGRAEAAAGGGGLDLVLVHADSWAAAPAGLHAESLPSMEVVAVGSVELFGSGPIEKALRTTPVLAVDPDCSSHQVLVDALRERYGIDPPVIEAGSVGGARELVRSGYGIAMLPQDPGRLGGVGSGLAVIPGLPWVKLGVRVLWTGREMATPAAVAVHGLTLRVF